MALCFTLLQAFQYSVVAFELLIDRTLFLVVTSLFFQRASVLLYSSLLEVQSCSSKHSVDQISSSVDSSLNFQRATLLPCFAFEIRLCISEFDCASELSIVALQILIDQSLTSVIPKLKFRRAYLFNFLHSADLSEV